MKVPLIPRFRNTAGITILLAIWWFSLFIYHEHIVPRLTARQCNWVPIQNRKLTNVLLVADPQLIDGHTYPGRSPLLLSLSQHTVDVYLKQNYKALVGHLQPDYIMFLGDYLDNGRLASDRYYESEFRRFERIFNRWPKYKRGDRWFTNVAGNHDIGFGDSVKLNLRERFASHFGEPNVVQHIDGADFVMLDTISYSSIKEDTHKDSKKFLYLIFPKRAPRIVLSHVPFYRDTNTLSCGPLRESDHFSQSAGYQYQLALSPSVLADLLRDLEPELIFSGDDHDYCDVQHPNSAREITVKSISMAMGIWQPAVQLLSFSVDAGKLDYTTEMCYLPRPYMNIFVYVGLAVVSALALLLSSIKLRRYVYSVLPSEHVTAVLLESGQAPMSKRMSKFLDTEDTSLAAIAPLSNYTHTASTKWGKFVKEVKVIANGVLFLVRRWNLITFFRLCLVLGFVAISQYMVTIFFI